MTQRYHKIGFATIVLSDFIVRGTVVAVYGGYVLLALTSIPAAIASAVLSYLLPILVQRNSLWVFVASGAILCSAIFYFWMHPIWFHSASFSFGETVYWLNGQVTNAGWRLISESVCLHFLSSLLGGYISLKIGNEMPVV